MVLLSTQNICSCHNMFLLRTKKNYFLLVITDYALLTQSRLVSTEYILASMPENLSLGFLTKWDSNLSAQIHRLARMLKLFL